VLRIVTPVDSTVGVGFGPRRTSSTLSLIPVAPALSCGGKVMLKRIVTNWLYTFPLSFKVSIRIAKPTNTKRTTSPALPAGAYF
jgi:hypothetical protein